MIFPLKSNTKWIHSVLEWKIVKEPIGWGDFRLNKAINCGYFQWNVPSGYLMAPTACVLVLCHRGRLLTLIMPLSIQAWEWIMANICPKCNQQNAWGWGRGRWGGGGWLRWTNIPSRGEKKHFRSCFLMQQEVELTSDKVRLCSTGWGDDVTTTGESIREKFIRKTDWRRPDIIRQKRKRNIGYTRRTATGRLCVLIILLSRFKDFCF